MVTAVVAAQNRAEARDRQDAAEEQFAATSPDLEELRADIDAQIASQAELDTRTDRLAGCRTPDVLDADPWRLLAYLPKRRDLVPYLRSVLRTGDLCLTLGACDLTSLADEVQVAMAP